MSFASKKLYTGDGTTTQYNVPFPFISRTHVRVFVNDALQLEPAHYTLSSSTVTFQNAPASGAAIEIKRSTSPAAILVDFVNGSVLNENDLDTAYLHNYYLQQETTDSFNEVINEALVNVATGAGIVETETDAVIAALVNEMISDAAAAALLAAVGDIDANAESVLEVQTDVSLMGVSNVANTAFIFNSATVKIDSDSGDTFATRLTALSAADSLNAADIITEQTARIAADAAEAALRVTLAARVTTAEGDIIGANVNISANATAITDTETDITTLMAKYGVTLDVDGYITGFAQNNDGTTGTFVVLADKFGIVTPSTLWAATTAYSLGFNARPVTSNGRVFECTTAGTSAGSEPTWDTTIGNTTADGSVVWTCRDDVSLNPFTVSGDKITMNGTVEINGSLLLNGSVVGASLVAGTIGSTEIGANAITTTQLNALAVTAGKIAANAVTATEINVTNLAAIDADLGSITAGNITLDSSGYIKGGQTGYQAGTGFFLGYDTDAYKFSIGDGGISNFISWDGTSLIIRGNISIGSYTASNTIMLTALIERNSGLSTGVEVKRFEINRPGTVRVAMKHRISSSSPSVTTAAKTEWKLDGVVKATRTTSNSSYSAELTNDITLLEASQFITVVVSRGWTGGGEPLERPCYVKDCYVKADKSDGESVITD